jgi:hypothetical protein
VAGFLRQHFDFHAAHGLVLRMAGQRRGVGQGQENSAGCCCAQLAQLGLHLLQAGRDGALRGVLQGVDPRRGRSGQAGAVAVGAAGSLAQRGRGPLLAL